jgi:hypothetical protein
VILWPTPDSALLNDGQTPERRAKRKARELEKGYNGNGGGEPLAYAAAQWPTPTGMDAASSGGRVASSRKPGSRTHAGTSLTDATCRYSLQGAMPSTSGDASSSSTLVSRRRLNPRFVSWLMGWPLIGGTGSDSSATASSHYRQRMQSALCSLVVR